MRMNDQKKTKSRTHAEAKPKGANGKSNVFLYAVRIAYSCFMFNFEARGRKGTPTKTRKRSQANKKAKLNRNGRNQIGRSAVSDLSNNLDMNCDPSNNQADRADASSGKNDRRSWIVSENRADASNKKTERQTQEAIFPYKSFLNLNKSQSYMLHKLMRKLGDRFRLVDNVIINDEAGIGLLNKCVRFKQISKRNGLKFRAKYDQWDMFVCVSSASAMVQHFFATSTTTKLLVNVLNKYHSTGLLIEKVGGVYELTSFDPNNQKTMTMMHIFCKSLKPISSKTRIVRCVSGPKNNTNDKCFAMSWEAIFKCFTGEKCLKSYSTQFHYDIVAKKKIIQLSQ